jgi:hypothetical protein
VAVGVAFGLLALSGLLGGISLIRMREPLMAVAAVAIPVCLVAASVALSIADRPPKGDWSLAVWRRRASGH